MGDKPRVSYADVAWSAAFARIAQGQWLIGADGMRYRVAWKHVDPDWLQLDYRAGKELLGRMVRQGDDFLLSLK